MSNLYYIKYLLFDIFMLKMLQYTLVAAVIHDRVEHSFDTLIISPQAHTSTFTKE